MSWALRCYRIFRRVMESLQSPLLLLIRLYWGWQFAETGWGKLHNIAHVSSFFTRLGLPLPSATAWWIALLEFCGGVLLGIGLASRPVAFLLSCDMIVAYIVADTGALTSFFSNPGNFYQADPFTFLAASLVVLIFGPGLFALDTLIARGKTSRPQTMSP